MAFQLMDPAGALKVSTSKVAPRLKDLKGVRLGLLDNGKTNAGKFLTMVGEILVRKYGVGEVKMFRKDALSKPAPREVLDALVKECDFGVTGIGDCGSCSTNSVHDGIEIEKMGIPAVAVCTEAFLPGLDALTKMRGMADYKFAVVPHPLGVLFDDELRGRAELAAPQIVQIVLENVARTAAAAPVKEKANS
ncbi:MAG: hypothetical protein A3G80_05680 [Betaproteobacteria bacterium RIFCSPLOWO2_12_FULL_62_13b]|nr:MAG: hypothetical protein A3G80_05680 [Betaproteobacteria bacterium RIFCSPLOWO2_12_FULL_62_13b]